MVEVIRKAIRSRVFTMEERGNQNGASNFFILKLKFIRLAIRNRVFYYGGEGKPKWNVEILYSEVKRGSFTKGI